MTSHSTTVTIVAESVLHQIPTWATRELELIALLSEAWRLFDATNCHPDGSLRFRGGLSSRDGVDDFYESFFNWPQLYLLTGEAELLESCDRHWDGVTSQLTELGMLHDEFDKGYDWFHLSESLLFAYFHTAASPAKWRQRIARFADLYVDPVHGNVDAETGHLRAPHTGSMGAREGLFDGAHYPWGPEEVLRYGYPMPWLESSGDGVGDDRVGIHMAQKMAVGDSIANLSSVGLPFHAWIATGDPRYRTRVNEYLAVWRRLSVPGQPLPDNVGPDGSVGWGFDGRWYGGHYGWTWPHGIYSVGQAVLVAAMCGVVTSADESLIDLARDQYDAVIEHARTGVFEPAHSSHEALWRGRLGDRLEAPAMLVPYRVSDDGWFDWNPPLYSVPFAIWHFTGQESDRDRLRLLRAGSADRWHGVAPGREKEDGGHESSWFTYLEGENDDYPLELLDSAIAEVNRRMDQCAARAGIDIDEADLHYWQNAQPVSTEALCHLVWGAPQVTYAGSTGAGAMVGRRRVGSRSSPGRRRPDLADRPARNGALSRQLVDDVDPHLRHAGGLLRRTLDRRSPRRCRCPRPRG